MDMEIFTIAGIVLLAVLLLIVAGLLFALLIRKAPDGSGWIASLQSLTQTIGGVHGEIKTLSERILVLERDQMQSYQALASLKSASAESGAMSRGLTEAASAIRADLQNAKSSLAALQAQTSARQELELRTADSIRRLETVIAGTQSKGAAGENILEFILAQLPAEWQVRNFAVGNHIVEFGLRLPNRLALPIDSKWAATGLLEEFVACADPAQQQRLKVEIERAVIQKSKEVAKYIDPNLTANFGIAAVPDAVFDLCPRAQVESMRWNVALISYSMFLPFLLLTFQTVLKAGQEVDLQKLAAYLENAQKTVALLGEELENRFSRALTMLSNSRDEIRGQLGKLQTDFTALQLSTLPTPLEANMDGETALPAP